MGLDNVAVQWPRTGRFYEPVAPAEFVDFAVLAEKAPATAAPAAALADHIAETGTVRATGYSQLIDLLLGLNGVLYATDAAAEDEDPVIDPDGCAWIAGGLERFVAGHAELGEEVTIETVTEVLRRAIWASSFAASSRSWVAQAVDSASMVSSPSSSFTGRQCLATSPPTTFAQSPNTVASAAGRSQSRALTSLASTALNG